MSNARIRIAGVVFAASTAFWSWKKSPHETWPQVIVAALGLTILILLAVFNLGPLFVKGDIIPAAQRRRLRRIALKVLLASEAVILPLATWRGPHQSWARLIGFTLLISMFLVIAAVHSIERERRARVAAAAARSFQAGQHGSVICDAFGYPAEFEPRQGT